MQVCNLHSYLYVVVVVAVIIFVDCNVFVFFTLRYVVDDDVVSYRVVSSS